MIWNARRVRFAHIQRKIILNRAMPERLRTLRHCIFAGWVVAGNGSFSAAFCESVALRAGACSPERADFPRPGEDVTAVDKKVKLSLIDLGA